MKSRRTFHVEFRRRIDVELTNMCTFGWKLIMEIDKKMKHVKLQYDINREVAKISGLSSDKIDKYEYFKYEDVLPSDQSRMID